MSLLALAKSNAILYGTGTVGLTFVSTISWKSADDSKYGGYFPSTVPMREFEDTFITKQVGNDTNNPLDLKAGDCFKRFFPGVVYSRPTTVDAISGDSGTPSYSGPYPDLSGNPFGCGIAKYAVSVGSTGDQSKYAFSYKSEFTVKNDRYALALSSGSTNLKDKGKIYSEYWLTFLEKKTYSWSIMGSTGWSTTSDITTSANTFTGKFIQNTWTMTFPIKNLDSNADATSYPPTGNWSIYTYSGFWISTNENSNQWFFFEAGGDEREGLKKRGYYASDANGSHTLETQTNLNQKGRWLTTQEWKLSQQAP